MSNEGYHEPIDELSDATRDMHRAIVSLMEELEAVDWYNQRVDACKNAELRAIMKRFDICERSVIRSSVMPSAKYSCSGSPLILTKGKTTIEGLSGSG